MIVVMDRNASAEEVGTVEERLRVWGFEVDRSTGAGRTILGAVGDRHESKMQALEAMSGVERVIPISKPYKLAAREERPEGTVVEAGPAVIGGPSVVLMAGPCAVESEEQLMEAARAVRAAGARVLRGGAFKPRSSPYSFQGLEEEGLKLLACAREETGLAIVSEVIKPQDVEMLCRYVDLLQVGARNMQNFPLLRELGGCGKAVLLKRGPAATVEEWLMAAEYIMASGNGRVVLCERGIRTFETGTRNTMDISAIPQAKHLSHLPVVADPSHGTGKRHLAVPMALAAVAAGADGVMVEVHPRPEEALSDGGQSLTPDEFSDLAEKAARVAGAVGRSV